MTVLDTDRRGPSLALAVLLATVALGVVAIAMPLVRSLELRETIATQKSTLATLARTSSAALPTVVGDERALLIAPTASRAGAKLQAILDETAGRHGVQLRSTQILQASADRDIPSVALEMSFEGDTASTTRFVHALEVGYPLLLIEELSQQLAKPIEGNAVPVLATALRLRAFINLREER